MSAFLTETEVNKFRSINDDDFEPEEEMAAVKVGLKRALKLREEHWTTNPPGTTTEFPTTSTPIKVLLVGVGGVGKSRLGSVLAGGDKPVFKFSNNVCAETMEVERADFLFGEQQIALFDTPGYIMEEVVNKDATFIKKTQVHRALQKGLDKVGDGIHVIIFVMSCSNNRTYTADVRILQEAMLLNGRTFNHCMILATHCKGNYGVHGRKDLLDNVKGKRSIAKLLEDIDERVVLVELGSKDLTSLHGQNISPDDLEGCSYECEKQQIRKMVLSMAASVVDGNIRAGRPIMYARAFMENDLQVATSQIDSAQVGYTQVVNVGGAQHQGIQPPNQVLYVDQGHHNHFSASPSVKGAECFPSMASVYTTRGKKAMKELQLHDDVLVVNGHGLHRYEPVFMFTHATPDELSEFISITTDGGEVLRLSRGHLLPVGKFSTLKPAQDVMVGDMVYRHDDVGSDIVPVRVMAVSSEKLCGLYCPHTPSGSIVVDGIVASCYTDILPPVVAHGALIPARVLHSILPAEWFTGIFSYDTIQGMLATLSLAVQATNTLLYG